MISGLRNRVSRQEAKPLINTKHILSLFFAPLLKNKKYYAEQRTER
jgi:hypothetical protein